MSEQQQEEGDWHVRTDVGVTRENGMSEKFLEREWHAKAAKEGRITRHNSRKRENDVPALAIGGTDGQVFDVQNVH